MARLEENVDEMRLHFASLNASVQRALRELLPKVEALLANTEQNGSGPSASHAQTRSLLDAALVGDSQAVFDLLKSGADINERTRKGDSALHLAAANGHEAILHCLISSGALVNSAGHRIQTPLHQAVVYGHLKAAVLLLNAGADIALKDMDNFTPLALAVRRNQWDIVKEMATRDVNLDEVDDDGNSLLVLAARVKAWDTVQVLCEMGASGKIYKGDTNSPLKLAARSGAVEEVKCLLRTGFSREDRDVFIALSRAKSLAVVKAFESIFPGTISVTGERALLTAANAGILESTGALLDAGVDINRRSTPKGMTPLMHAAMKGHVQCVRLLLHRGASKDKKDDDGDTALHLASRNRHEECVRALLEAGADWKMKNKKGKTPFQLSSFAHPEIVYKGFLT